MKLLIIMGSGGHTAQMSRLVRLLGDRYQYEFLLNDNDVVTRAKLSGNVHILPNPRLYKASLVSKIFRTCAGFFKSFGILRGFDAVISAGPGVTVPVFYAAKIMGKKTIFLESWSRAQSMSVSGRLCYPISDLFFVQWPELRKKYKRAVYAGRLG